MFNSELNYGYCFRFHNQFFVFSFILPVPPVLAGLTAFSLSPAINMPQPGRKGKQNVSFYSIDSQRVAKVFSEPLAAMRETGRRSDWTAHWRQESPACGSPNKTPQRASKECCGARFKLSPSMPMVLGSPEILPVTKLRLRIFWHRAHPPTSTISCAIHCRHTKSSVQTPLAMFGK